MNRSTRPELADVFRRFETTFFDRHSSSLVAQQRRVFGDIVACRTAALGSHTRRCDACDHEEISYNSCRNRHCPKCQGTKQREWLDRECAQLIAAEYFHVVFTLPAELGPLALCNQRVIYGLLFEAAADAISTIARDPRHLGATPGVTAVLHTWGQTLDYHPHVHCVVPGGGWSVDGSTWIRCPPGFFLPVRLLSRRFRETFLRGLERERQAKRIRYSEATTAVEENWNAFQKSLRTHEWVVYAKPPFGGPEQVLKYLARYTHRVAIANSRIVGIEEGRVLFRWRSYRAGKMKTMSLAGEEFVRRFLLHVLPPGFVRIRHYGFLANRVRTEKVDRIRQLMAPPEIPEVIRVAAESRATSERSSEKVEPLARCPKCRKGWLRLVELRLPSIRSSGPG